MARKKKPPVVYQETYQSTGGKATIKVYPYGQRFLAYFVMGRYEMPVEASTSATTALEAAAIAKKFMGTSIY